MSTAQRTVVSRRDGRISIIEWHSVTSVAMWQFSGMASNLILLVCRKWLSRLTRGQMSTALYLIARDGESRVRNRSSIRVSLKWGERSHETLSHEL